MGSNEKVEVDGYLLTPVEISARILLKLKMQAEEILKEEVTKAVITVPAHFDDAARNDTKLAANIAGLEVLRLINEPTAAALAYGLDHNAEGIYLIYDFGGGTFDVSILKMQKGIFQVLATGGDSKLGGDDIDDIILKHLNLTKEQYLIAKEAKEAFSNQDNWQNSEYSLSINQFNQLIEPLIQKTIDICKSTIKESGIDISAIKDVVLVGGSSRINLVKEMLSSFLKKPLDNINPDIVVALGAAIQADSLTNGSNNLLLDVTSLSIGLEVMGGMNERIINKNSPIPSSTTKYFTTYQDGQTGILFHIVQGEREMVEDCRSLARFELKNIPPMKASLAKVAVTFNVDADGLLTVTAKEELSGVSQVVEMKPSYGLSLAEVENMLEQAYINAKKDMDAKQLAKAKLSAQGNIKNLRQALEQDAQFISLQEKESLNLQINKLESIVNSSDLKAIEHTNQELEKQASNFIQERLNRQIKQALHGKSTTEI
jgi:molecular chaperone HscA